MEETLKKEVLNRFNEVYSYIKSILDEEISNIDREKIEDGIKIVIEQQDLYEDWIDKIDSAPLPELERIQQVEHNDGIHVKLIYSLKSDEAKQVRKVKVRSNGKVDTFNYIFTWREIEGIPVEIKIEYDTYGNLIFNIKKIQKS
ncbi:hypothetical protein [Persephonella sp.]